MPATSSFVVRVNGGIRAVDSVSISGREVTLTLSQAVSAADEVTWLYQEPVSPTAPALRAQDGNYAVGGGLQGFQEVTNETPRSSLEPLTARFTGVPASHDGAASFTFNIEFSEPVWVGYGFPRDDMLTVTGGTVTSAHWLDRTTRRWAVTIQPDSQGAVTVVLPKERYCESNSNATQTANLVPGAPCAPEDRRLSNEPRTTVPGPSSQQQAANSPATGGPSIDGSPRAGETLTATTSSIADEDGMTGAVFAYQWIRHDPATTTDTDIEGATDSTYIVTTQDEGKGIKVRATFTDDAGNQESVTSYALIASPAPARTRAPTNSPATGAPAVEGRAVLGETLTATTSEIGDEDGTSTAVFAHQWLADHAAIKDATASTYTPVAEDLGRVISVRVSFTDDAGNEESLTSNSTAEVAPANSPATGAPTITGTAQEDETLRADTSGVIDADGLDNATFTYQWTRIDTESTETDISGATSSTYTLVSDDLGKTIRITVSFTDDAGNSEELTSTATVPVAPPPPLTGTIHDTPDSHDGKKKFTFELRFSEELKQSFSFKTLRDHAFTVTGGKVVRAKRLDTDANVRWKIHVRPDSSTDVTIVLPMTTDCAATGAICTEDGRMLSGRLELTIAGP